MNDLHLDLIAKWVAKSFYKKALSQKLSDNIPAFIRASLSDSALM